MVFIRKKTINGKEYAYLVKNKWTKKGSRQKAKYLGKIVKLPQPSELTFLDYLNHINMDLSALVRGKPKTVILHHLVTHGLLQRGFDFGQRKIASQKKEILSDGKYYFDGLVRKLTTGKEVIVEMNEGFFCSHSLKALLSLKPEGYDEREQGVQLAKALLEAGLKVDHEVFVLLFERWVK